MSVLNPGRKRQWQQHTKASVFAEPFMCGSLRRAGSNGVLPLPIMQILVGWPSQCIYPLEARRRAGHCGCGTRCHVPKDRSQSAAILHEMRRPSYDKSSSARIGGRLCSDVTDVEIQSSCSRQLCRNSFPIRDGVSQTEGFSKELAAQVKSWRIKINVRYWH